MFASDFFLHYLLFYHWLIIKRPLGKVLYYFWTLQIMFNLNLRQEISRLHHCHITNVATTALLLPDIRYTMGKIYFFMKHTYNDIHKSYVLTCAGRSNCPCLTWRTKPFSQEVAHSRWPRLLELQFARVAWWICGSTQLPFSLQVCWVQLLGRERGNMYKQNTDTHIDKMRKISV